MSKGMVFEPFWPENGYGFKRLHIDLKESMGKLHVWRTEPHTPTLHSEEYHTPPGFADNPE